jgi:hypothetical protein
MLFRGSFPNIDGHSREDAPQPDSQARPELRNLGVLDESRSLERYTVHLGSHPGVVTKLRRLYGQPAHVHNA